MKRRRPRTCVGCRKEKTKREMLRIVRSAANEEILIDASGKAPGRGAYVCKNRDCVLEAKKSNALSKALRVHVADSFYADLLSFLEENEK